MLATLLADAACVDQLLKRGAHPNQADNSGATALMWAMPDIGKARVSPRARRERQLAVVESGAHTVIDRRGIPWDVDLLDLLLAKGADLRARDTAGFTALAMAMRSADVEVLRFLVAKGLDPKDDVPAVAADAVYTRACPAVIDFVMTRGLKVPTDVAAPRLELAESRRDQEVDRTGRGRQRSRRAL